MKRPRARIWQFNTPALDESFALAAELGVSLLVAQLLINRGLKTAAEAHTYLYPKFEHLHDAFEMADMAKAVERINRAIKRGENICVYGDYDTDGTTATALLLNAFRHIDVPVEYYIPNRFDDGYGLSEKTVEEVREKGTELLITVDCGIKSVKEVERANELGMDVIITDHHQPEPGARPAAHALISPKVEGNEYPYPELAGVGLAFKVAQALIPGETALLKSLLDLVALGTVVDIAPLTGENRVLSRLGLEELNKRKRPGIRALCTAAGLAEGKPLVGRSLSFGLGPRINAAGRLDTASKVVQLLTTESDDEAKRIATELNSKNQARRELETSIRDQAEELIEKKLDDDTKGIVVASEWDDKAQGVVGIVASRLMETYHKPVIVLAIKGEESTGSGRCIEGMNLADSLNACDYLLVKHGGHAAAAGLTLKTRKIPEFREAFDAYACANLKEEHLQPKLSMDFETSLSELTLETLASLSQLEPFGEKNPAPRFGARNVKLVGTPSLMGNGRHLKMRVSDGTANREAIAWQRGEHIVTLKGLTAPFGIAFSPEINEWQGHVKIQLILKDWKIGGNPRGGNRRVFPAITDGEAEPIVKVINSRGRDKKDYLLKLLTRDEAGIVIYVQNRKMQELLLTRLIPEKADCIAQHDETTTEAEEAALVEKLARGDIRAIASSATFSKPERFPFVKHFVFCHLSPTPDEFFKRCQPAFATEETSGLHLIYADADVQLMNEWITQKYPAEAELRRLYAQLRARIQSNGTDGYPVADLLNGTLGTPASVQTGLTIFEELRHIELNREPEDARVHLLPSEKRGLETSHTYLKGQWIRETSPAFVAFQLQEDIKLIWERIAHECRSINQPNSGL